MSAAGGGSIVAKATNPNSAQSPTRRRRVVAAERTRQALEMRMEGLTFDAIAAELGVSKEAARKAVLRAVEATKSEIAERADELRAIEAQRLERVTEVLWPLVLAGDLRAIDRLIRVRESFRRLTGIDLSKDTGATATGDTYIVQAGGDISLVPPGGTALVVAAPWERGELESGEVIDADPVVEDGDA